MARNLPTSQATRRRLERAAAGEEARFLDSLIRYCLDRGLDPTIRTDSYSIEVEHLRSSGVHDPIVLYSRARNEVLRRFEIKEADLQYSA